MTNNQQEPIPFIRRLCAHKTESEIQKAEENFRAFIRFLDSQHGILENETEE